MLFAILDQVTNKPAYAGAGGGLVTLLLLNLYQLKTGRTVNQELKSNGGDSIKDVVNRLDVGSVKFESIEKDIHDLKEDIREIRRKL